MAMLEVRDLEVYYGVIQALKGISFDVDQGEIVALIGANGAGKTTTLHTVTGLLSAKAGKIVYEGTDITRVPGYKLVSMGIAHVPEGRRVFATLTVLQNLKMGAYTRKDKNEMEETLKMIYKRFPRLEERKNQLAGTLSGLALTKRNMEFFTEVFNGFSGFRIFYTATYNNKWFLCLRNNFHKIF